jgi:hypothetical protein
MIDWTKPIQWTQATRLVDRAPPTVIKVYMTGRALIEWLDADGEQHAKIYAPDCAYLRNVPEALRELWALYSYGVALGVHDNETAAATQADHREGRTVVHMREVKE